MASRSLLDSLFGKSPIGPIQDHMRYADQAAQLLPRLFRAAGANDWELAAQLQQDIVAAEHEADALKRSVRRHMPNSLLLPVPRYDLLALIDLQDNVANTAKDVAGLIIGRRIRFPDEMQPQIIAFADACAAASHQTSKAIQELDELLEVGFTGREVQLVEDMLEVVRELERETDSEAIRLRAQLHRLEKDLPPVDVMFYYQIISLLGDVADDAESVGDLLQVLMAK